MCVDIRTLILLSEPMVLESDKQTSGRLFPNKYIIRMVQLLTKPEKELFTGQQTYWLQGDFYGV